MPKNIIYIYIYINVCCINIWSDIWEPSLPSVQEGPNKKVIRFWCRSQEPLMTSAGKRPKEWPGSCVFSRGSRAASSTRRVVGQQRSYHFSSRAIQATKERTKRGLRANSGATASKYSLARSWWSSVGEWSLLIYFQWIGAEADWNGGKSGWHGGVQWKQWYAVA